MAKQPENTSRKSGKATSAVVWVLMGMLVLGLGGFGLTNFSGTVTAIGSVGDRKIDVNEYARALQQEINAMSAQVGSQITMQQAQAIGLDRQVRQRLVNTAVLDNETARIGVSASDARVYKEVTAMPSFQGANGAFDADTYRFTLQRNNLTEAAYETRVRDDIARSLLQGAVTGGLTAPPVLTDTLYAYISERRGFSLLRLNAKDLETPIPDPTDDEVSTYYTDNIADFTQPEARRITYASLLPEDIASKMTLDEETLKKMYQDRLSEFVQPEKRLVERLVFPTEEAAADAKARLDAGTNFDDLVAERGVKLDDIDLGDKSEAELGAAGPAVFALTKPGIAGPVMSDLGPALFRMNAILAAQSTSFEDAREDLAAELSTDAARRAISDQIEELDDRLAGGATLEDLATETDMTLGSIDFTATSDEGMAAYPDFREAAARVAQGDFPEIIQLDDGGVFGLRLDEIIPPAPIPLEEARDAVTEAWKNSATAKALSDSAIAIKSKLETEAASLGSFGIVEVTSAFTRSSTLEGAPASLGAEVFQMKEGEARVLTEGDFVAVLQLNTITPGAAEGPDVTALKTALDSQIEQAMSQDVFALFTNAMTQNSGISINDAAINAVHAQFP